VVADRAIAHRLRRLDAQAIDDASDTGHRRRPLQGQLHGGDINDLAFQNDRVSRLADRDRESMQIKPRLALQGGPHLVQH
jgi:hypothetical protein